MILADKIIRERKKLGLSQEELAEKMNVSRQAVSKWESSQSIPEIEKILQLSSLFGVTTDYLLKDEIENVDNGINLQLKEEQTECSENKSSAENIPKKGDETLKIPGDNFTQADNGTIKKVTMREAENYLNWRKKAARNIAVGVILCILPVSFLLSITTLNSINKDRESAVNQEPVTSSENTSDISNTEIVYPTESVNGSFVVVSGILGVPLLFFVVAAAVGLFVYTGIKSEQYKFYDTGAFETEEGVVEMVKKRQKAFGSTYTRLNIIGAILCVLSPISLFVGAVGENSDSGLSLPFGFFLTLLIAGIGAVLFILAGVPYESIKKLLKEGEYSDKKEIKRIKGTVGTIYWLLTAALFLIMQFVVDNQGNGGEDSNYWIIWPVAGVLFPVALLICDIAQRKKEQ